VPPTAHTRLPRWLRILRSRPRLLICNAVGVALTLLMPAAWVPDGPSRGLLGWNAGALLYLTLAWQMVRDAGIERMRQRALEQDEGRKLMLMLMLMLVLVAVLAAVGTQLSSVKDFHGVQKSLHIGLAAFTVLSAWAFTQTMFTLHYAHGFYAERHHHRADPLQFPGTADPDYADFFCFACVIGT